MTTQEIHDLLKLLGVPQNSGEKKDFEDAKRLLKECRLCQKDYQAAVGVARDWVGV